MASHLFRAYAWLRNYGQLPGPGAWVNQTGIFIRAVDFCDLMISKMNDCRKKQNEENELKLKLLGKR